MTYFDTIFKRVFGNKTNPPAINVDELIKRSDRFMDRFEHWRTSEIAQDFINDIWESYYWRKRGIDKNPPLVFFESSNSNGFAIDFSKDIEKDHFQFLFEHLAQTVKGLAYRLVTSRRSLRDKGSHVEKKEMHYLKPAHDFKMPIDQKYGNVQIEYIEHDNQPIRIKFIANSYPDRKYTEPLDFEMLAEKVLSQNLK